MVTNVSWHTSKCCSINFSVRAKIHLYNYVIFMSNFHLQFHLGKNYTNSYSSFPSLPKSKQLSGVAVKQRCLDSSFVFSTCFLNTVIKIYLLALLSLILHLITEFFLILFYVPILHPWLFQRCVGLEWQLSWFFLLSRQKTLLREGSTVVCYEMLWALPLNARSKTLLVFRKNYYRV